MRDEIKDNEICIMTQAEKQVVIDSEIDKILSDLPDYRRPQPSDKFSLEPIKEDEQGKFIHGQKWPLELPDASKKLKSASRRMRSGQIKPKETKKLRSMLFEFIAMQFKNGQWVDSGIFSTENKYIKIKLSKYPVVFYIPAKKLLRLLNEGAHTDYVTGDEGNEKFVVVLELDRKFLLDNDVIRKYTPLD